MEEKEVDKVSKAERLGRGVRVAPADDKDAMALPVCGTLDWVSWGEKDAIGAAEKVPSMDTEAVTVAVKDGKEADPAGVTVGPPGVPLTATTVTEATPVPAEEGEIAREADKMGVVERVARLVARLLPLPLKDRVGLEEGEG